MLRFPNKKLRLAETSVNCECTRFLWKVMIAPGHSASLENTSFILDIFSILIVWETSKVLKWLIHENAYNVLILPHSLD